MTQFHLTLMLITIVYGLVLMDLFVSLHRLIKGRERVKWHWLSVLTAWYILLILLRNWWALFSAQDAAYWNNFIVFLGYSHSLILIYLIVSSIFPDSVPESGIDLKEYYFSNCRYFWGLLCGLFILTLSISIYAGYILNKPTNYTNIIAI